MDTITSSFLNEFSENNNCSHLSKPDAFEHFANFCVLSSELGNTNFDLFAVSTGSYTQGIDGIAIIVNNKHCGTVKEVEDLLELNGYLDVKFILVQSKASRSFDNAKILNFLHYSQVFFSLEDENPFNTEEMKNFLEIRDYIFSKSSKFTNRNPTCKLFYCSTGKWNDEKDLVQLINANKAKLQDLVSFEELDFVPIDNSKIQDLYRRTKLPVQAEVNFEHKVYISDISDVTLACSGVLPFEEFRKIIMDDNGQLKPVFEDNIRDYLTTETNEVNSDIAKTIQEQEFDYFSILNNGVTVVAEDVTGFSNKICLKNYQIVNGCQTSHVLYEHRKISGIEKIKVPVKIIVTDKSEIKSKITRATNNQTQIGIEQLEALSVFQKRLEMFYEAKSIPAKYKIFYERRTNQHYKNEIPKFRIITIEIQVKAFSAMFRDSPHEVSGHYGKLLKQMGQDIFHKDHCHDLYYISALAYFVLDQVFQKGLLDKHKKKYRFHILTVFRYLVTSEELPALNSQKKVENFAIKFEKVLTNEQQSIELFQKAFSLVTDSNDGIDTADRKATERKSETAKLCASAKSVADGNKRIPKLALNFDHQLSLFEQ
ncbi:AIPR family protein [Idiomarina sp.]|uniref:AIPR family protein n=1 Tax=Idiomarina sp. TaxID=1874361 RepID=UPI001DDB2A50|nr:AIPR family protein [Idiomarina sp.]MCJ8317895.1 AIPR family protein [Idiomarina sp.]NQZ17549.1 AIPR family protein [Idiomarina sp.]